MTVAAHLEAECSITPPLGCLSICNCSRSRVFGPTLWGGDLKGRTTGMRPNRCCVILKFPTRTDQSSLCLLDIFRIYGCCFSSTQSLTLSATMVPSALLTVASLVSSRCFLMTSMSRQHLFACCKRFLFQDYNHFTMSDITFREGNGVFFCLLHSLTFRHVKCFWSAFRHKVP